MYSTCCLYILITGIVIHNIHFINFSLLYVIVVNNGTNGPIRLSRNGVSTPSLSSGRVDVLFGNRWGYICNDDMFGIDEANVICHQLGYTGAMAESRAFEDGYVIVALLLSTFDL